MAIYKNTPPIVTNGLVLHLDAGSRQSYVSGSTTWSDLSGQANNGTLSGSILPTFNSANQGSINCSGSNWIDLGAKFNYTSESFSFSYWVNANSLTTNQALQGPVILYKGSFNTNGYYTQINPSGSVLFVTNQSSANQISATTNGAIVTGSWYNITHTRSGSSARIYINGIDNTLTASIHTNPVTTTNPFRIANYQNGFIYGDFKTATFTGYNRALSATEVAQNYNALKSRFGY